MAEDRASRHRAAHIAILEQIATGAPLAGVLEAVVRMVENRAEGMRCTILLLDREEGRLRHGAASSLPPEYTQALDGARIGPAEGSCGTAAFHGTVVVVESIETDPRWAKYKHLATPHGLRACWSTPIFSAEREVLGTFAMYYAMERGPTDDERVWVAEATHAAGIAIARNATDERLRRAESRARHLARIHAVASGVAGTLVRERDPSELYRAACRITVETGLAALAWVGTYDEETDTIVPVARFGGAQGYERSIRLRLRDSTVKLGPAAKAILTGVHSVSNDIATDKDVQFGKEAIAHGIRSCAVFPIIVGDKAESIFAIYGGTTDFFGEEEVAVLGSVASNIAIAVASVRAAAERTQLDNALGERVKELTLLHRVARLVQSREGTTAEILASVATLLRQGWRVPSACEARVEFGALSGQTAGFAPSPTMLTARFEVGPQQGLITIAYRGSSSPSVFLPEEHDLLRSLADMLATHFSREVALADLRERATQLQIAGKVARVGGFSFDVATQAITWTEQLYLISELAPETPLSLPMVLGLLAPEGSSALRQSLFSCVRTGAAFDVEVPIVAPGRRRVWVRVMGQAERDAAGGVWRIHGAVQDIDEHRKMTDQLRQSQKMNAVGQLAGGIAHDFNNLLSVIVGYTSILLDTLDPKLRAHADVEQVHLAGVRASELTRQLLTLGRQQLVNPRRLNLNHVIAGMGKMLRHVVGDEVSFAFRPAEPLGVVLVDRGQVEHVLLNLVLNARDAMPSGGSLTIETANVALDDAYAAEHAGVVAGDYVMVAVTDTGHGMDAETSSRIFEPFFTTKDKGKGTGLGLATVYGIIAQGGGHLVVYSEPQQGTSFKVYLPQRPGDTVADEPLAPSMREPTLRGSETILVVEDSEVVRTMLGAVLRRAGYHVIEAESGADALISIEQSEKPVALVLTDLSMPRMNGRELAERLRRSHPDLRIVFMSGYAGEAVVKHGILAESAVFLAKPIATDTLLRTIRDLLKSDAHPMAEASTAKSLPARRGEHVLHVDDEEALVELVARVLTRLGYRVTSFSDSEAALAAFTASPGEFDALVTDVSMPGLSGFELVRAARAVRAGLPVVITSGQFRAEDLLEAEQLGLEGSLIVKPRTVEELGGALDETLRRARS